MNENENNLVDINAEKRKLRLQQDADLLAFNEKMISIMIKNKVIKTVVGQVSIELHPSAFEAPEAYEAPTPPLSPEEQKIKDDELLYYSTK